MADVEARMIVKVVDQATKSLGEIKKGMTGLNKAIQDNKESIKKFGLYASAAGGAIVLALGAATSAAREQIAVEKQLDAVLASTKGVAGLTAKELKGMASALQNVTNFGDEAIMKGEALMLTFTRVGRDVFPQAMEAALNVSAAMGQDLKSSVIQLGKALNDPVGGIAALTRVGIQFSDEQQRMIKTMVEANDMIGAQKVILKELETQFGGAARAVADPMTQLKNSVGDLVEEIGMALIPILNDLVRAVLPVVQKATEWMQKNPELTKTLVAATAAVGALLAIVGPLALGIVALSSAITATVAAFTLLLPLIAVGGPIAVALGGIGFLVYEVTKHWEGLKWMAAEACDTIVAKAEQAMDALKRVLDRINVIKQAQAAWQLITGGAEIKSYYPEQKALGGASSGGLTLVGERGPELVDLPRGSFVHTAGETTQMLKGGVALTIGSVNVYNEADEDRLIEKLTRMIQLHSLAA